MTDLQAELGSALARAGAEKHDAVQSAIRTFCREATASDAEGRINELAAATEMLALLHHVWLAELPVREFLKQAHEQDFSETAVSAIRTLIARIGEAGRVPNPAFVSATENNPQWQGFLAEARAVVSAAADEEADKGERQLVLEVAPSGDGGSEVLTLRDKAGRRIGVAMLFALPDGYTALGGARALRMGRRIIPLLTSVAVLRAASQDRVLFCVVNDPGNVPSLEEMGWRPAPLSAVPAHVLEAVAAWERDRFAIYFAPTGEKMTALLSRMIGEAQLDLTVEMQGTKKRTSLRSLMAGES